VVSSILRHSSSTIHHEENNSCVRLHAHGDTRRGRNKVGRSFPDGPLALTFNNYQHVHTVRSQHLIIVDDKFATSPRPVTSGNRVHQPTPLTLLSQLLEIGVAPESAFPSLMPETYLRTPHFSRNPSTLGHPMAASSAGHASIPLLDSGHQDCPKLSDCHGP